MSIELEPDDLRDIIEGKTKFRKCPSCEGSGMTFYIKDSDFPVTNKVYEENGGASNFDNETACCNVCRGVGYVSNMISF
jgi:hypothetical protein